MKQVVLFLWLSLALPAWSQNNTLTTTNEWARQFKEARRVINGVTINLTPLIKWQQEQELAMAAGGANPPPPPPPPLPAAKPAPGVAAKPGAAGAPGDRPLKPWAYIQGIIVETPGYGWVIRGSVDGQSSGLIVLRNPPKERYDEYNRLKAQLGAIRQRIGWAEGNVAAAQKRLTAMELEYRQNGYVRFGGDPLEMKVEELRDAKLALSRVSQDVDKFDSHGYDLTKDFVVQCFAMRTGQAIAGKPVYDPGTVIRF